MKLIDIVNRADAAEVCKIYDQYHANDGWSDVDVFNKFRDRMNQIVSVKNGDMRVVINLVDEDGSEYIDVIGQDSESTWSLSFTPWEEWKAMDVEDDTGRNLSLNELASHIYYEITWYGWPETAECKRDELLDQVESLKLDVSKLTSLDDFLKEDE